MGRKKTTVLEGQIQLLSDEALHGPKGLVALNVLRDSASSCTGCDLHETRNRVVFGEGPWDHPLIAFVGEAPGQQEDETGTPFVGRSGQLFDRMLDALGLDRKRLYVTNTVLCRPPNNAIPTEPQLLSCERYLYGQLTAIDPQIIVALGRTAAVKLTGQRQAMSWLRGRWHAWRGIKVRVTWHPSYILRNSPLDGGVSKREAWADMGEVLQALGMELPRRE